jgi:hypothetical protein
MMRTFVIIWMLLFFTGIFGRIFAEDTLQFRGQFSAWGNVGPANDLPVWVGGRIIPQANYGVSLASHRLIDFEVSANIFGSAGFSPFDSLETDGNAKAYRVWARFSGKQFELRAGLQKINFGSASMLRPLMWFDQLDPRDPLQLTAGVWGLLGRYYLLNNANIWLWALYGNRQQRAWEILETPEHRPEFGGRIQVPLLPGEAAVSYHYRSTQVPRDVRIIAGEPAGSDDAINSLLPPGTEGIYPEHRFALDGKWDVGPGIWFESVWIHNTGKFSTLSNQTMITLGADYTFGLGNGLNLVFEHMFFSSDKEAFAFDNSVNLSALSASYPLGMNHHLSAILYRDWENRSQYSFLNWRIQFNRFLLYTMAYWNPIHFQLPQMNSSSQLFTGKGVQIMLVYNF